MMLYDRLPSGKPGRPTHHVLPHDLDTTDERPTWDLAHLLNLGLDFLDARDLLRGASCLSPAELADRWAMKGGCR
jgi:hypothetical protein